MGFRFRKSIKIAPGIRLNITKKGISSVTIAGFNIGKRGVYKTFDLPGTGLSYRAKLAGGRRSGAKSPEHDENLEAVAAPSLELNDDGTIDFFDEKGKPLDEEQVQLVRKEYREEIVEWLEAQVGAYNTAVAETIHIHLTTPPPTAETAVHLDDEAMSAILAKVLAKLTWPRETLVSFDVVEDGRKVLLDVDLPEIEDMPDQEARADKRQLQLTLKERTTKQQRLDYLTHIHAVAFRLIGEVFARLPSVQMVVLSGFSQRTDKQTGHVVDEYLYSVRVPLTEWAKINFENLEAIDVAASLAQFELRRKMTATGVISPIEPFAG